jgi:site-specific DNA recombinase
LEQDYNSLHAHREECEAFLRSQVGQGRRLVKTAYEDSGFPGAGSERPGLPQLQANIRDQVPMHWVSIRR